jgi:alanine racemase
MTALPSSAVDSGLATELAHRSTHAVIDLDAIADNARAVRASLSDGTALIAVVKGNGYGHGSTMVARAALDSGAGMLAVATVGEGQVLRRNGVDAEIVVLGPVHPAEFPSALSSRLTLTLVDAASIDALERIAGSHATRAAVHLKIDTGMHRFGCSVDDAVALAARIAAAEHLHLQGVFTHFAEADAATDEATCQQASRFDEALAALKAAGIDIPMRHAANSGATLRSRDFDYDAIRLGVALYGLAPSLDVPLLPGMRPAMTLRSRIARIHELKPGDRVSYGGTYVAERPERVALVPCGYADGYRRSLSNRGWLGAGGERLPIRGRVCMDQLIVGLTDSSLLQVGDSVTLIGDGSDAAPTADDLAAMLGTINYEIVTSIAARVPRVYVQRGEVVAVEDLMGLKSSLNPGV